VGVWLIAASLIRRAEVLLRENRMSRRRIALELGISRTTVGKVASGVLTSAARQHYEDTISSRPRQSTQVEPFRCPRCGGTSKVFPCQKCFVETVKEAGLKPLRARGDGRVTVGLDLKPAHFVRYQEVRRWRREANRQRA
jgi:hypothetical protein